MLVPSLLAGAVLASTASACTSYGIDQKNEGAYSINKHSNDPFTAVSQFNGCTGTARVVLISPKGDSFYCSDVATSPDYTDVTTTCPLAKNQMYSGDWQLVLLDNKGDSPTFSAKRVLHLTLGDQDSSTSLKATDLVADLPADPALIAIAEKVIASGQPAASSEARLEELKMKQRLRARDVNEAKRDPLTDVYNPPGVQAGKRNAEPQTALYHPPGVQPGKRNAEPQTALYHPPGVQPGKRNAEPQTALYHPPGVQPGKRNAEPQTALYHPPGVQPGKRNAEPQTALYHPPGVQPGKRNAEPQTALYHPPGVQAGKRNAEPTNPPEAAMDKRQDGGLHPMPTAAWDPFNSNRKRDAEPTNAPEAAMDKRQTNQINPTGGGFDPITNLKRDAQPTNAPEAQAEDMDMEKRQTQAWTRWARDAEPTNAPEAQAEDMDMEKRQTQAWTRWARDAEPTNAPEAQAEDMDMEKRQTQAWTRWARDAMPTNAPEAQAEAALEKRQSKAWVSLAPAPATPAP